MTEVVRHDDHGRVGLQNQLLPDHTRTRSESDVRLYHLHIDPRFGQADLDVVLPMRRLTELAQEGAVRQPAPRHYSIMGYILEPDVLVGDTAPAIAERMHADGVDAAALVPV